MADKAASNTSSPFSPPSQERSAPCWQLSERHRHTSGGWRSPMYEDGLLPPVSWGREAELAKAGKRHATTFLLTGELIENIIFLNKKWDNLKNNQRSPRQIYSKVLAPYCINLGECWKESAIMWFRTKFRFLRVPCELATNWFIMFSYHPV